MKYKLFVPQAAAAVYPDQRRVPPMDVSAPLGISTGS